MTDVKLFKVSLITQEKKLFEEDSVSVTLPGEDGEMTALPGHANCFVKLREGIVIIRKPDKDEDRVAIITGGFCDITSNQVKILADLATRADELNEAKIEIAKKEAEEAMKSKKDTQDYVIAEAELRKSLLELQALKKWKKIRNQ